MPLRNCQHWIFDMDGTLTNAAHDFEAIRANLGINSGKPILEAIDNMPATQQAAMHAELHRMEMDIASKSTQQPGADNLLKLLSARGCNLGILTRNACDIAATTLKACGLFHYFDADNILGRESCAPKPSPAGIHKHLEKWRAPKDATVMVGDYLFDLESGFNAEVRTVHLDIDGQQQWPEFTTVRVSSLDDLITLIP